MKLLVERWHHGKTCTVGNLFIEYEHFCFVLEDVVREVKGQPVASWKVYGETAIPSGLYVVRNTWSNRFQQFMPLLADVPGFEGVRIHVGNFARDTEGCLLVGYGFNPKDGEAISQSRKAYDALMARLKPAFARSELVTLEVV